MTSSHFAAFIEAKKKLIIGFTISDILTAFGFKPPADRGNLGNEVYIPSEIDDDEEEEEEEEVVDDFDLNSNDHGYGDDEDDINSESQCSL
ncbi:hypothetical protein G7Y89_g13331 [Cudoniella acicularis]|uniref:Uncharacterized protein n=1 Tax=Cudoniella acicularis TaxID=354080 RepID=A0A8H4VW57_9HELO|nr:hypothetical protein G7Y89_g13331 [Cudoniella acicularis]